MMGATNCGTNPAAPPVKQPRLYGADSKTQSVFRLIGKDKEGKDIYDICKTTDPCFDEFTASKLADVIKFKKDMVDLSWKCEKWK